MKQRRNIMKKFVTTAIVLGLLVYGAYLLTLQAPMLVFLWMVLLYWAGFIFVFIFVLVLLVLGIRSVFRPAVRTWHEEAKLAERKEE
jgi:hypothetical protein